MADIVFKYVEMRQAVSSIKEIAEQYKTAASNLESGFLGAISGWEGASKDAMANFMSGPVMEYTRDSIPQLLNGLAELLEANAAQMENADQQIADNIPKSLG